jgi:hypothetical protein
MTSQDGPVSESRLVARRRHSDVAPPAGGFGPEPPAQLRVLVVDEHPLSRVGMSSLLDTAGLEVVGEAESAELGAERSRGSRPTRRSLRRASWKRSICSLAVGTTRASPGRCM